MTTLGNADLPSDDSDDEDYNEVDAIVDEVEGKDNTISQIKTHQRNVKIGNIWEQMKKQSQTCYNRKSKVDSNDFMLQFHMRHPAAKSDKSQNALELHMKKFKESTKRCDITDIETLKSESRVNRETLKEDQLKEAVNAVASSDFVEFHETVRFAGQTVEMKRRVDKNSLQHQQLKRKQKILDRNAVGGAIGNLNNMIKGLTNPKSVNSVDKSLSEWRNFKGDEGLENELKKQRQDGYLTKQAFLQRTDLNQWENEQMVKKKKIVDG
eukprot:GHVL01032746.1.p1 GENE.GHVL01032746.1~~GHVL01032746.1.p1  ORF type:complete len:267 (-),score=54.72 GHVL01032746.1:397-1197(-)